MSKLFLLNKIKQKIFLKQKSFYYYLYKYNVKYIKNRVKKSFKFFYLSIYLLKN